jgi:hypothetical protein
MAYDLQHILALEEFRVAIAPWPQVTELLATLAMDQIPAENALCGSDGPTARNPDPPTQELTAFVVDLGTSLWRLRNHLLQPVTKCSSEDLRRTTRHLESILTALTRFGIGIMDHTNEPFHHGLSLRVISYQPIAGLAREQVIETIRPTIYLNNTLLQMGEVIVGTPGASSAPEESSAVDAGAPNGPLVTE